MRCPCCDGTEFDLAYVYDEPPQGETRFQLGEARYEREYRRCATCAHLVQVTQLNLDDLYGGDYVEATYAGDRLERVYEEIMALPPSQSDNAQRVDRLVGRLGTSGTLLDVGSGLGVFPARMRDAGWTVTALDPDPRACAHLRDRVGVEAVEGDFMAVDGLGRFEVVSFNKVLEHVADPVAMLTRTRDLLAPGGTALR